MNHPSKADWTAAQALILAQQQLITKLREENLDSQKVIDWICCRVGDYNLVLSQCDNCEKWELFHFDDVSNEVECLGCKESPEGANFYHEYCKECMEKEFCHYNMVCKLHFSKCNPDCPGGHS